ncbi:glycosyltransferase [Candidatus Saccharibacteria bacterium]|nr:glycosyltransferase [Candidatus Saccharibacteria bacterium]MBR3233482.1 glycosyltransferase [Candidatus Saccharibacteria bacterium]
MENNQMPWDISLAERKEEVVAALKSGKKVALMLYPKIDQTSSFRYRSYNIYRATKFSKKWQLVYFYMEEIQAVFDLLPKVQLLVFGRIEKWSNELDELALLARQNNIKIAYDLDDCVCGLKHIKEMFNVVSPDSIDQEYWINASAQYELISYLADGFIVTNDYLGKILSESHDNKPYMVIRNSLNQEQIDFSKELLKEKNANNGKDFIIGYFSGSHTHACDFEVVYPELLQLLDGYSDMKLRIVGMLKLPASADKYIKSKQIEFVSMVDFLTLQRLISEVNVNIAPLANNVFTNCKSELKFFEAALVKTPTIASPTFSFKNSIKNNKTGFLCQPGEWYDRIVDLYKNRELGEKIASEAHNYCLENYAPSKCLEEIEKAYDFYGKK